jgi:hypothetical protein
MGSPDEPKITKLPPGGEKPFQYCFEPGHVYKNIRYEEHHLPETSGDLDVGALISATLEFAQDHLTSTQKEYIEAYLSLEKPTDKAVAEKLNKSPSAVTKLRQRIRNKLFFGFYHQYTQAVIDDCLLEYLYKRIHSQNEAFGPYLELRRGKKGFVFWKPVPIHNKRIGMTLLVAWQGIEVEELLEEHRGLPIIKRTVHGPSPLNEWWHEKVIGHADESGMGFEDAWAELYRQYYHLWPDETDYLRRHCLCCGSLLPLGEIIDGKKVTINRKLCSDNCKKILSRSHKK